MDVMVSSATVAGTGGQVASTKQAKEGGTALFSNVLDQRLTGASAEEQAAGLSATLQLLTLQLSGNAPQGQEAGLEQIADQLAKWLEGDQDELNDLLNQPELQDWFAQLQQLLFIMSDDTQLTEEQLTAMNQISGWSENDTLEAASDRAGQWKQLLGQFVQTVQQQPNHPGLQQLAQAFKEMMQPIMEKKLELHVPAVEQASSSQTDSKLAGSAAFVSQMNSALQAKSSLNHLASRSVMPFQLDLLNGPKDSSSMPNHEIAVDSALDSGTATGITSQTVDSLRSQNEQVRAMPHLVHAQAFAEEMSELMLRNIRIAKEGDWTQAKITLHPETLGQVDIKLTLQNGQLIAHFAADTVHGKEMIESQLAQLRANLQNLGLQVDKLEVTQGGMSSGMFQEQRQQQFGNQSGSKTAKKSDGSIQDEMEAISNEQAAQMKKELSGGTIDVSA
ncbi:flagellar hook-length control protein FliK [Paenibacillus sp. y28]|uniref:flagellar hook-length control protein FliK n=1 Tax=Paenibacillus sp. y28 TaxID=3129110 RepID=UPI00301B498C